jgi:hypothetical protein
MTSQTHTITWRGIAIEITHTPAKWSVTDHIELRTTPKTPLPVTETGYRSECFPIGSVAEHGGAVAFVVAWLDHEAERKGWRVAQLSLF